MNRGTAVSNIRTNSTIENLTILSISCDQVKEGKLICFFGGENKSWIVNFITKAKECWQRTNQKVEMVYIYNKSITEEKRITEIKQICEKKVHCWDKTTHSTYFWNRIDSVVSSKTKKTTILKEATSMIALGNHEKGWGLIGSTAIVGDQISITKAKGDKMLEALGQYDKWSVGVKKNDYIAAIHDHLVDIHEEHKCEVYRYPGHEAYPEVKVCSVCARTMERTLEFTCSAKKTAKKVKTEIKAEAETKVEEKKVESETTVEEETETKVEEEIETTVEEESETTVEEETETKVEEEVETKAEERKVEAAAA